jgi:uroporphyrinogen decarboxylase
MERKERVLAAIEHKEADRIPIHINATKWVVKKLKKRFKVQSDRELFEKLHIDIYDMRGIDIHKGTAPVYQGPANKFFPEDWGGNVFSFWGIRETEKETSAGWLWEVEQPPLANAESLNDLEKYDWINIDWFDFSMLKTRLSEWEDYAIMASGCSVFQHATFLRGMDHLMMDMCIRPEMADYILGKFSDFYFEYYKRMFESTGELIDILALADDFGMQNSLLLSPDMFDTYIAPHLKRMVDLAHSYNKKLLLHSCGNIELLIPRLIEAGVDILDPIQPECMDPISIKEQFGKDICLRGGISVQNIVSRGTKEEVKRETERIVKILKQKGGYIFAPGHPVLQDDIPVENIIALYESGYIYGQY